MYINTGRKIKMMSLVIKKKQSQLLHDINAKVF